MQYEQRQWAKALTVNPMVFWEWITLPWCHSEYHTELGWERQVWYMLKTQTEKPSVKWLSYHSLHLLIKHLWLIHFLH